MSLISLASYNELLGLTKLKPQELFCSLLDGLTSRQCQHPPAPMHVNGILTSFSNSKDLERCNGDDTNQFEIKREKGLDGEE